MALTKEQIVNYKGAKPQRVEAPEFGGDGFTFVRELSVEQIEDITGKGGFDSAVALLAASLCDADGQSLGFTEDEVKALKGISSRAFTKLLKAANKANGLDPEGDLGNLEATTAGT